jgi:hypothetical protein
MTIYSVFVKYLGGREWEYSEAVHQLFIDFKKDCDSFLISNFCHVLYVVCFLLGNSPASEFYMPTFQNTLSVPSS